MNTNEKTICALDLEWNEIKNMFKVRNEEKELDAWRYSTIRKRDARRRKQLRRDKRLAKAISFWSITILLGFVISPILFYLVDRFTSLAFNYVLVIDIVIWLVTLCAIVWLNGIVERAIDNSYSSTIR